MKLHLLICFLCVVVYTEARFAKRETEEVTTPSSLTTPDAADCCYPRPSRKRNMKKCCEIPIDEIFDNLREDINKCKEDIKKKKDEAKETSTSTSTTVAPTTSKEVDEADLLDPSEDETNEVDSEPLPSSTMPTTPERSSHGRHHGSKGFKHRGKGKCVKTVMENRKWANEGRVDFDAIAKDVEKATTPEAELWKSIVLEAIQNCSKQPIPEFEDGKAKHYSPEKAAYRCIKNSAMMHCPNFPESDEYCVALREVYQRCGARKVNGRRRFAWCEGKKFKSKHTV